MLSWKKANNLCRLLRILKYFVAWHVGCQVGNVNIPFQGLDAWILDLESTQNECYFKVYRDKQVIRKDLQGDLKESQQVQETPEKSEGRKGT